MSAPRLSVPLMLESPVRQPDGMGGFALDWQLVGQLWAEGVWKLPSVLDFLVVSGGRDGWIH
ncbi:hypothetical protein SAMN06265221_1262 [Paracoccus laeviglucosivorans]|uniref:Uncharacterized protein n=1 Tax=Paracoccus laeviglucosivorans TaxID=1197861 RepID=A0A521FL65_9RHOB|nr:hypothetical protein SAMN06265221_1262 [Paracoccus laeviglucosivorans]